MHQRLHNYVADELTASTLLAVTTMREEPSLNMSFSYYFTSLINYLRRASR